MDANVQQGRATAQATAAELKRRGFRAITAPIPQAIRHGTATAAVSYREKAAIIGAFIRTGAGRPAAEKACQDLETLQASATTAAARREGAPLAGKGGGPLSALPDGNHGENQR